VVAGVFGFTAGVGVLSGKLWARIVGVVIAASSLLISFAWLPWYPIWSVIIIGVNAMVIWALTIRGHDIESLYTD